VKVSRWVMLALVGVLAIGLAAGAALITSDSGSAAGQATFKAALVSDIGSFNDKSFNESQLDGLKRAKTALNVDILPLESKSSAQYAPNFNKAVRGKADLIIAAGFLLANTTATYAKKFPDTKFAITDYGAGVPPLGDKNFKPLYPNVEGLTYAANEGGCLVGVLAAKMAAKAGQ
jgi:basic membrane protein A